MSNISDITNNKIELEDYYWPDSHYGYVLVHVKHSLLASVHDRGLYYSVTAQHVTVPMV